MRLANRLFALTTKCRRIRAQQSASSLNFVLDQLARVLRVARRMRCRRYLQALPHQLIRHRFAHRLRATLPRGIPRGNPDPPRRPGDRTPTSNLPCMAPCLSVSLVAPWPPAYRRRNNSFSRRTKRSLSSGSRRRLSRSWLGAPARLPQNPPRILYLPISREYRVPMRSLPGTSRHSVVSRAVRRCWYLPGKLFAGHCPTHTLSSLRRPRHGHRRRFRRVPKKTHHRIPCPPRFPLRRSPTTPPVCT